MFHLVISKHKRILFQFKQKIRFKNRVSSFSRTFPSSIRHTVERVVSSTGSVLSPNFHKRRIPGNSCWMKFVCCKLWESRMKLDRARTARWSDEAQQCMKLLKISKSKSLHFDQGKINLKERTRAKSIRVYDKIISWNFMTNFKPKQLKKASTSERSPSLSDAPFLCLHCSLNFNNRKICFRLSFADKATSIEWRMNIRIRREAREVQKH